jgi:hypothetical protein
MLHAREGGGGRRRRSSREFEIKRVHERGYEVTR